MMHPLERSHRPDRASGTARTFEIEVGGRRRVVSVDRDASAFQVRIDGEPRRVDAARIDATALSLIFPDRCDSTAEVTVRPGDGSEELIVELQGRTIKVRLWNAGSRGRDDRRESQSASIRSGGKQVVAPMPGKVVRLLVRAGDRITAHQAVAIVEAMKMENELKTTADGVVKQVLVAEGALIDAGAVICVIE